MPGKTTPAKVRRYPSKKLRPRKKARVEKHARKRVNENNGATRQCNLSECTAVAEMTNPCHRADEPQDRTEEMILECVPDSVRPNPSHRAEDLGRTEEMEQVMYGDQLQEEERQWREAEQQWQEEERQSLEEDRQLQEEAVDDPEDNVRSVEGDGMHAQDALFGRCIANFPFILEQLAAKFDDHNPNGNCALRDLKLVKSQRLGLKTHFILQCQMCETEMTISTDRQNDNRMDVNRCAVSGTISTGIGYSQMEEFLASMDIPCMAATTYRKYNLQISEAFAKATTTEIASAAEESRNAALQRGDFILHDNVKIPFIAVVADGSWMKRSYKTGRYDSLSGVGVILDNHTGKVLFRGVRNKYCAVCEWAERHGKEPNTHVCFRNWGRDQASTAMESYAIAEGFKNSVETNGLIYKTLIADGDSSVYKAILDSHPYAKYDVVVDKKECVNHLKRNLLSKIRAIAKTSTRFISNQKKMVEHSVKAFRIAVTLAVQHRQNSVAETPVTNRNDQIALLEKDIANLPHHVFGDHQNCKDLNGFCNGDVAEGEQNVVDILKKAGLFDALLTLFSTFSLHAPSLMYGATNNIAEAYNSIVCKFIGGKRINFGMRCSYQTRCDGSVLQHNTQSVLTKLHQSENKEVPRVVAVMEARRLRKVQMNALIKHRTKASRTRNRNRRVRGTDKDYGPNAQRPDMPPDVFQNSLDEHRAKLLDKQRNRVQIERDTRRQADDGLWQSTRKDMLTASNFGKVCRLRPTTSCASTVRSILFPSIRLTPAIIWGRTKEPGAIKALQKILAEEGNPDQIMPCGLFIDPEYAYLGASPDGTIGNDGIVEMKCPYSARMYSPDEAIRLKVSEIPKFFSKTDNTKMNTMHPYYYQVQGQLHITQRKFCLFAVWTPLGLKYVTVLKDDDFWQSQMEPKLSRFYNNCLLPEIVDSRSERNMPIRDPDYILAAQQKGRKRNQSEVTSDTQMLESSENVRTQCASPERDNGSTTEGQPEIRSRLMLRFTRIPNSDNEWMSSTSDEPFEAVRDRRRVQPTLLQKEHSADGEIWRVSSSEEHSSNVRSRVRPTILTWSQSGGDDAGQWGVSSSDEHPRAPRSAITPNIPCTNPRRTMDPPAQWVVVRDDDNSHIPTTEDRVLLESLNNNTAFADLEADILLQTSLLNDTSIDNFLNVVRNSSTFHPRTALWLTHPRFIVPCTRQDIAIIGGNQLRHWRCIHFDGIKLNVYDSLFDKYESLKNEEIVYISLRYPNLTAKDVSFPKVQKQPDSYSCGVYAAAFATTIVLGGHPSKATYSKDVMKMRRHLLQIIERKELSAFPSA